MISTLSLIKSHLNSAKIHKDSAAWELEQFMENEEYPLYDRWCAFLKFGSDLLPTDNCTLDGSTPSGSWYFEQFDYPENRCQTIMFRDVFDEYWVDEDCHYRSKEDHKNAKAQFETIPEEVVRDFLKNGYSGFLHDW